MRGGGFTSKEIWEILHKQKGGNPADDGSFELAILKEEDGLLIHPSMGEKAKVEVTYGNGASIGKELNKIIALCDNQLLCFVRNDVQPTHDHWLKRITTPFKDASLSALQGKEISTPDANYLLADDLSKKFDVKVMSPQNFSMSNSAISSKALINKPFDENANDPLTVWAVTNNIMPLLAKEAIAMRYTRIPLSQIYRDNFNKGYDLAISGKRQGFLKTLFLLVSGIFTDSVNCLKNKSPQHLWFPFLYRANQQFGLYLGGKSL